MKKRKIVPAVFFQKELSGPARTAAKPERLELFEEELKAVTGGMRSAYWGSSGSESACNINGCCQLDDCID